MTRSQTDEDETEDDSRRESDGEDDDKSSDGGFTSSGERDAVRQALDTSSNLATSASIRRLLRPGGIVCLLGDDAARLVEEEMEASPRRHSRPSHVQDESSSRDNRYSFSGEQGSFRAFLFANPYIQLVLPVVRDTTTRHLLVPHFHRPLFVLTSLRSILPHVACVSFTWPSGGRVQVHLRLGVGFSLFLNVSLIAPLDFCLSPTSISCLFRLMSPVTALFSSIQLYYRPPTIQIYRIVYLLCTSPMSYGLSCHSLARNL